MLPSFLLLLTLLGRMLSENVEILDTGNSVEEPSHTVFFTDNKEELPSDVSDSAFESISVSETLINVAETPVVADVSKNITNNVTLIQPRPVCEAGKGCRPQLQCLNFSSLNDSDLESIVGQRRAVIVSADQLESILENRSHVNACVLVMFYGQWCPYSIEFAPVYNALGTMFPDLLVVAVDFGAQEPDKFVLAYLPRVLIYYNGRAVFNIDTFTPLNELEDIVSNMTGMLPNHNEPEERSDAANAELNQLPTARQEDRVFLIVCVLWLAFVFVVQFMRSGPCYACLTNIWTRLFLTTTKRD